MATRLLLMGARPRRCAACASLTSPRACGPWQPPGPEFTLSWPPLALKKIGKELCAPCLVVAREVFTAGAQRLWDDLPGIFGMDAWEELLKVPPYIQDAPVDPDQMVVQTSLYQVRFVSMKSAWPSSQVSMNSTP
ncbi:hypothetical protein B0H14DRAFT_2562014 [Mycena olivaceomarginata]|nr:hypothetical protein B0H14DRAFT_2562014 [Mycena olivaceomarginata]